MKQLVAKVLTAMAIIASTVGSPLAAEAISTTIVINEVDCHGNDWIEVGNRTTRSIDISGWLLSDKALNSTAVGHVYTFPSGTRIAANGRLVVQQSGTGAAHLGFGVDCTTGATIKIGYRTGTTYSEIDSVTVPPIAANTSYGRLPDLTGGFGPATPTKNLANYGVKPILTSGTTKNCVRGQTCRVTLTAKNSPTYRLATAVSGVSITSAGVMTVNSSRVATFRPSVIMTNSFGTTTVTITVNVRAS